MDEDDADAIALKIKLPQKLVDGDRKFVDIVAPASANAVEVLDMVGEMLQADMLWTDYALCVSSSAIDKDATDDQAVAFRSKRKVLKLRENKPLAHYRRILENAVCVNLIDHVVLDKGAAGGAGGGGASEIGSASAVSSVVDSEVQSTTDSALYGTSERMITKALPTLPEKTSSKPLPTPTIKGNPMRPISSPAGASTSAPNLRAAMVSPLERERPEESVAPVPQSRPKERSQSSWISAKAPSPRLVRSDSSSASSSPVVPPRSTPNQQQDIAPIPKNEGLDRPTAKRSNADIRASAPNGGSAQKGSGTLPNANMRMSAPGSDTTLPSGGGNSGAAAVAAAAAAAAAGGSPSIVGKIRQVGETAYMFLKFHFPPNFPVESKLLEVDLSDTPAKAIRFIAERLKFPIATNGIALRIPDETLNKNLPCVAAFKKGGTAPFLDMKKYRLAYYRDLLAATAYVDYVYRFEHEKDEAKKNPTNKSEALEAMGEWLWATPDRTGCLNRKESVGANVSPNWILSYCVLQANLLFFFKESARTVVGMKPESVVFLRGAEIVRSTRDGASCIKITEKFFGSEMTHYLAQSGLEDLGAWTGALLQASTTESSAVAVTKVTRIQRRKSVDYATLISKGDPHTVYHNFSKLGDGGYATVWRAYDESNQPVALKVMVLRDSTLKSILEELANHKAIEHPNIVKFYAAYFEAQTGSLWVALQFCGGGTLTELCKAHYPLPEPYIAYVCNCVLSALYTLHERGLVHRDIKSNNILLGDTPDVCMVSDFGLTVKADEANDPTKTTVVGTPLWMAPEIFISRQYHPGVDIWALGVVLIEMAEGRPCYHKLERKEALKQICTKGCALKSPESFSREMQDFAQHCLDKNPQRRYTAEQLLNHSFLKIADCSRKPSGAK